MSRRQLPRWSELRPLLRVEVPNPDPVGRRLSRAHTIADLRGIARRRTPRAVFDYTDGAAAKQEISLRRARRAFRAITRTLQLLGVPAVDELTGEHATLRTR